MIYVLVLMGMIAAAGGALLCLVTLLRVAVWRFRAAPLHASRSEFALLIACVAAALLGVLWLSFAPAYAGQSGSGTLVVTDGVATSTVLPGVAVTRSFLAANGAKVLPLLALPVLIALLPFTLGRWSGRPVVEGLCALLLGSQFLIGSSGYGAVFAPSGLLMLAAGMLAPASRPCGETRTRGLRV